MKKGICFFDLDGTILISKEDVVPESALRGLSELKENGYVVCLSTGRDMDTHYSRKYVDIVKPDAIIHHNGVKITIGGQLIFEHFMDKSLLRKAFDYAKENGLCLGTSVGDHDYFTLPKVKTAADLMYKKESKRNYRDPEYLFTEDIPVSALSFAGADLSAVKDQIENDLPEFSLFLFDSATGADCVEKGFSKADGMKRVCDYYGVPMEKTYAFGDSENDIPMLLLASAGVAMGNARDAVKKAADYVTNDIKEDGIYVALRALSLIG